MPNVKITDLPAAQPLDGSEIVPMVQNGITVRATTAAIAASPSLTQTILTVNQEPTLPNSRALSAGTGLGLTDGGALSTLQITLNGASGSLETAGNGLIAKTASNTVAARSIAVSGTGLAVSNGDGVAGNPTLSLDGLISAIAQVGGTGLLAFQGGATAGGVLIAGTANQIDVANGNGSGGNPTISIVSNPIIPGTAAMKIPVGTSAQQPVGADGQIRFNSDTQTFDGFASGSWNQFSLAGGVTTFDAGSTGFTPASPTSGAVVLGGILNGASGGTGVANSGKTITLGGNLATSGAYNLTLTLTAGTNVTLPTTGTLSTLDGSETLTNKTISGSSNTLSNIGNSSLTNSSITINGSSVSLGGSVTVTATASNALTIGTGLSGTSYNGSAPVTIAIDSTVATLTGSQTLTNKSMSGASNTFTNIPNGALSNSSVTFNGTSVSLGGSGTITANTTNSLTFNNSGTGDASGTTFDGSSAKTISYNTVGASPLAGSSSITTVGTVTSGTWNATAIANNYLANSSITIGSTSVSLGSTASTLAGLTSVTVTQDPTSALQLATKQYVDAVAEGLHVHAACAAATTGTLASITGGSVTYNNGTAGVGATLTLGVALTTLDGYTLLNGDRILVKNEATQANNGIYTWATGGTVLTRATDFDTSTEIASGDFTFVSNGTLYGDTGWVQTDPVTTVGTDPIVWVQFSGSGTYTAGTGLTLTGSQFSLTSPVAVTLGGTGLTSGTSGGVLYFSGSTAISSSGVLASNALMVGGGAGSSPSTITTGTGVVTALGVNVGTAGAFVVNGGALGTPSSGTVTNLTGTASININGTVGATTPTTGAFTTISASGVITSTVSTGTAPFTVSSTTQVANLNAATAGSATTATTATNATNTAIALDSTNATNYLTFVSATTGNLPQLVNSSITCNPSTGAITGGVAGGTF